MGLGADVATGIGDDIDFKALFQRRQHRADDADAGPQTGEHDAALADLVHPVGYVGVFPTVHGGAVDRRRSEEHTSELQSLMRISYAVFCLKKKNTRTNKHMEI